jgi:hypothetical protein
VIILPLFFLFCCYVQKRPLPPCTMRNTAKWAIEEKRRLQNHLSDAAEDHCERLRRALHRETAAPLVSLSPRYAAPVGPLQHTAPAWTSLSTSLSSDIVAPRFPHRDLLVLFMEELHQRASLQLFEATQYSDTILQPFATAMMLSALRFEIERDETVYRLAIAEQ